VIRRAVILTLIGVLAAWSWLFLVAKWGPANRIDILTFKAGLTSKIMRTLLREGRGTGHHSHASTMISGVYATPTYFAMTEQAHEADRYVPERFAVFYVFEDIHVGQLPRTAPTFMLRLDDGRRLLPVDREVVRDSFHHRATVVRFARTTGRGEPLIRDDNGSVTLVAHDMSAHAEQAMQWTLPIVYPTDIESHASLSLPTLLALLAGLLAVLSPCLLQLTVYYTFALAGLSVRPAGRLSAGEGFSGPAVALREDMKAAPAKNHVIGTALFFIAGFTLVFTAAGALAGFAGETLQASGLMEAWNRPLAIVAGLGIVILGIWVGASSGAPGLCRLPALPTAHRPRWLEAMKATFLGSAFAIGCSTCFGGALFISLMIYVGAVGSASLGALTLFLFSIGIAIPYLLAAAFLSRALPLVSSMSRVRGTVGLACSVALVCFGVILITDNFHVPSDLLYRLLLGS
jgi:cytochrome c-type biogenesis protein